MGENIKPKLISDVKCTILFERSRSQNIYCLGNAELDRYIEVKEVSKEPLIKAIKYFDGTNTIEDIRIKLESNENISMDINKLYKLLQETGLIQGEEDKIKEGEIQKLSIKLFEFDISFIKELRLFDFISKLMLAATILLIPLLILGIKNHLNMFMEVNSFKVGGSYIYGYIVMIISATISLGLHELAHGLTAKKYGLTPKKLVFSLYMFISFMIYVKIPGIYTIKPKNRIKIWSAGILTNLFLACISMAATPYFNGIMLSSLFLFSFLNIILVVSNLCPFLPLDGYFILTTIMKMPNLRKRSFKELKRFINKENSNLNIGYVIYLIFVFIVMGGLIGSQFISCGRAFWGAYNANNSIMQGLLAIKIYLILIVIIIFNRYRRARDFIKSS